MTEKIEELRKVRLEKLEQLKKAGIDPYPVETSRTHSLGEATSQFEKLSESKKQITLVGRVRSIRTHGKLTFGNLEDGTGHIQFLLREDSLGEKFKQFAEFLDIGDFLEITGSLSLSKTGEKTLEVGEYRILTKSIRPIPQSFYGLKDVETRLRKRYLDLIVNEETRELFRKKAIFWNSIRQFLLRKGFLEVETPILENVPGGAEAEPFVTHHKALDRDFYLRISLELPLKRLLVGGYDKVFEIGRIFRNEGISSTHLQDYTQMEFYWAYADFDKLMDFVREMYQYTIKETFGTLKLTYRGIECDWSGEWEKKDYLAVFLDWTGIDLDTAIDHDLKKYADKKHIKYDSSIQRGRLIDLIFKKERSVRSKDLKKQKPFFLINQPIELEPLAKKVPGNPKLVQRMQIIAYYMELGKGFGELNDPIDQRVRFEEQMKLREAGDKEAQMIDEDYLEAMEYGMPPAVGFGVSERLFSVLVPPGDKSIRETVIFPPMKNE